jgi:hypothetical protein
MRNRRFDPKICSAFSLFAVGQRAADGRAKHPLGRRVLLLGRFMAPALVVLGVGAIH